MSETPNHKNFAADMPPTRVYPSGSNTYYGPSQWSAGHQAKTMATAFEPQPFEIATLCLDALVDMTNFTQEARDRRDNAHGLWSMPDVEANELLDIEPYFSGTIAAPQSMIEDDKFEPWLREIQSTAALTHIAVVGIQDHLILADLRHVYVEQPDVLRNFKTNLFETDPKYWIFCSGNHQTPSPEKKGFSVNFRGLDMEDTQQRDFVVRANGKYQNFGSFMAWARKNGMITLEDKDAWYQAVHQDGSVGDRFELSDKADYERMIDQFLLDEIKVAVLGDSSDIAKYKQRTGSKQAKQRQNNHWWVTAVNTVTGEAYIHDSFRHGKLGVKAKANALISNLNWLISKISDDDRAASNSRRETWGCGPWASKFTDAENAPCAQQTVDSNDCGIYMIKNIDDLVAKIAQGEDEAFKSQIIKTPISGTWINRRRGMLLREQDSGSMSNQRLTPIEMKIMEHPLILDRALWHLQHAGAILLSFNHLDPDATQDNEEAQRCPSLSPRDFGCGFTVIPVPRGHKVLLQSETSMRAEGSVKKEELKLKSKEAKIIQDTVVKLNEMAGETAENRTAFIDKITLSQKKGPKILVGNSSSPNQGGFLWSNAVKVTSSNCLMNACGYNMRNFPNDVLGPIPRITYIRINERLWAWIKPIGIPTLDDAEPTPAPDPSPTTTTGPLTNDPPLATTDGAPETIDSTELRPQTMSDPLPRVPPLATTGKAPVPVAPTGTPITSTAQSPPIDPPPPGTGEEPVKINVTRQPLKTRQRSLPFAEAVAIAEKENASATEAVVAKRKRVQQEQTGIVDDVPDDSPDDSLRREYGLRVRKKRKTHYAKPNKRMYDFSDSELGEDLDFENYGTSRVKRREAISTNVNNLAAYLRWGLEEGNTGRGLVTPDETLLAQPIDLKRLLEKAPIKGKDKGKGKETLY